VPGFPNLFCMYGPGTNAVNGASIIYNSECQMRYALACIDLLLGLLETIGTDVATRNVHILPVVPGTSKDLPVTVP
ncbi:hypothetical protein, partial [Mycolicibacterium insubricum]|uniref:hypothetical protein n=1 Tax=Mycolicibacterium insubricum TaxID=444597 RepID=UPI0021F3B9E9